MPELVPVDHNPFALGPRLLKVDGLPTGSPLGLEMMGAGVPTKAAVKPDLVPVEHNPFAQSPVPDAAKLRQFERLEKKGAPDNITRTITGLFRDESGKVREVGEKPESKTTVAGKVSPQGSRESPRVEPEAESETKAKIEYPARIIPHEKVSPEFVRTVESYYDKLPLAARRVFSIGKSKLYLGEKLTDHSPWLAGKTPRGWSAGDTWEMAEGLHREGDIHIARTYLDRFSGKFEASTRIEGALNHESGHAFDYHMGRPSQSEQFLQAYARDRNKIVSVNEHARELAYFLQQGEAGPMEAFAELFARAVGPGSTSSYIRIGKFFPHADAYMRDVLRIGR